MIDWFFATLKQYPEIAIFLALALGYYFGKFTFKGIGLGSVTATLIAGVIIGQIGITINQPLKAFSFLMFLFAVGYGVGPQFFAGLGKDGLKQILFSVIVLLFCLGVPYICAKAIGYDEGTGAGLLAGAMTESATIGTAGDALSRLPIDADLRVRLTNNIPIAFAVTYLVGVVSVAWFLSQVGPRIMRVDIAKACRELEEQMSAGAPLDSGVLSAWRAFELRAYRLPDQSRLAGRTIASVEAEAKARVFVERIRRGGAIVEAAPDVALQAGDVLALSGPRAVLVELVGPRASEVEDRELLDMPTETVDVYLTSRSHAGRTLRELSALPGARGVFLRSVRRHGVELPFLPSTVVERGDILTVAGPAHHVEAAVGTLGYADRITTTTDMVFVGMGVVLGSLVGLPAILIAGVAIGLSQSVGALVGGLAFGWLRSVYPAFGRIPEATLWLFESLGLAGFIAVVGLQAGPDFVRGLAQSGPSLIVAALVVSLVPHLVGVLVGYYVLRMHPGIVLGVCAGAGTATPALAAIQEAAKSRIPTLGYGVAYAIGNVLLALWGTLVVNLLH
jgi:putative transport protein